MIIDLENLEKISANLTDTQTIEEKRTYILNLLTYMRNHQQPEATDFSDRYNALYNKREQIKRQQFYKQSIPYQQTTEALEELQKTIVTNARLELKKLNNRKNELSQSVQHSASSQDWRKQRHSQLKNAVLDAQENYETLQIEYEIERLNTNARVIQRARVPVQKAGISYPKLSLLTTIAGIMLCLGFVTIVSAKDYMSRSSKTIESYLNIAVLDKTLANNEIPDDFNTKLFSEIKQPKSLTPQPELSNSTTCLLTGLDDKGMPELVVQIASDILKRNKPLLIIDSNLSHPGLNNLLDDHPGLINFLEGDYTVTTESVSKIIQKTGLPNVYYIRSGKPALHMVHSFDSKRMFALFNMLKQHFPIILVYTSNFQNSNTIALFHDVITHTFATIPHNHARLYKLHKIQKTFLSQDIPFTGIILTE